MFRCKMARRNVVTVEFMRYRRRAPEKPFLGWGYEAVRKLTTRHTSPVLLSYKGCIAREMAGKKFANLKEVQTAFKEVAGRCKAEARGKAPPTKPKVKA